MLVVESKLKVILIFDFVVNFCILNLIHLQLHDIYMYSLTFYSYKQQQLYLRCMRDYWSCKSSLHFPCLAITLKQSGVGIWRFH